MQYQGGKAMFSKYLVPALESMREGRPYLEPFCGSMNVLSRMSGERKGSDLQECLISFYGAVRGGWNPTEKITQEVYQQVQELNDSKDPMTALCQYGLSYRGISWGGYIGDVVSTRRPHAPCAVEKALLSARKKTARMEGVKLSSCSYRSYTPENTQGHLIYCDPPYAGTKPVGSMIFNHAAFWTWAEEMSKENLVLVSEYSAPSLWESVWSKDRSSQMLQKAGQKNSEGRRTEHLFQLSSCVKKKPVDVWESFLHEPLHG